MHYSQQMLGNKIDMVLTHSCIESSKLWSFTLGKLTWQIRKLRQKNLELKG